MGNRRLGGRGAAGPLLSVFDPRLRTGHSPARGLDRVIPPLWCRLLSGQGCLPPTIILTTFDNDDILLEGLRAGAKGYLLKDVSLSELVRAIRAVAAGGTAVQPIASERVVRGLESAEATFPRLDPPDPLTEREVEVLRLMTGGYSNREIARALNVAEGTVKNHVSSILSKLGVRDRTRAVLQAARAGYLG